MPSDEAVSYAARSTCMPSTVRPGLNKEAAQHLAVRLKAIADPTRLRLISLVAAHENAEACVCDLTDPLALTQGTVSHHLKVLVDAGLFVREQRGTWAFYSLVPGALEALTGTVAALRISALD